VSALAPTSAELDAPRGWAPPRPRTRVLGALALAHAAVIWLLLQHPGVREASASTVEVTVRLLGERKAPPQPVLPPDMPLPAPPIPTVARIEPPTIELAPPSAQMQPAPPQAAAAPVSLPVPDTAASAPPAPPPAPIPRTVAITEVQYLVPPAPDYPLASRRLRETGTVQLRVLVDAQGRPQQVVVQRESGHPRLDQAARAAVDAARFKPYTENGRPQPFWVVVPIAFE
jgi:periplasmic protein TonB